LRFLKGCIGSIKECVAFLKRHVSS
jgi:hypothetical protein